MVIADQVRLLNPMAEAKHLRISVSMDAFARACRWQGLDPDDPATEEVWGLVKMLASVVYEGPDQEGLCWHPHLRDPTGLLTEYHPKCPEGCARLVEAED